MMAEQLCPCPAGHEAGEPHGRGWPDQGWIILCLDEHCGWEMSGDSREDVICRWNDREPGPATAAMREYAKEFIRLSARPTMVCDLFQAFIDEWPEPATPPALEQPSPPSPWKCNACGKPVRINDDLRPYHVAGPANHEAELSSEDLKTLADGLRMSD